MCGLVGPDLSWIPVERRRARMALAALARALNALGVLCATAYGDCISDFEGAEALNIFSVVEDEEDARAVRAWFNKTAKRYEHAIGKLVVLTVVSIDELDEYSPSELDEALGSGIQIAGDVDKSFILGGMRRPHALITLDMTALRVRERLAVRAELFGTEEVVVRGPDAFKSTRAGALDKLGAIRVGRNAFIVPRDRIDDAVRELEKRGVRYFIREVVLSENDIRHLKSRSM
ncbi:MAG TPA: hypothetical protein ENF34_02460 [Candidatus Bathyarchaeota archaeon]|nr:MAG: hypothetical protein DRO60_00145 [Candidatus Bathyarchaeota archaeon]HDJ26159.1 hypothetical protein [Candidatus Bathyarchaeota archaeon]